LLVVAIAVLVCSLQGYAVSLADERRRVDPYWGTPEKDFLPGWAI
jgi:hypothetical protein